MKNLCEDAYAANYDVIILSLKNKQDVSAIVFLFPFLVFYSLSNLYYPVSLHHIRIKIVMYSLLMFRDFNISTYKKVFLIHYNKSVLPRHEKEVYFLTYD